MARLFVDTKKYLEELVKECSELGMKEYSEIENIQDMLLRREQAEKWLTNRLTQLERAEGWALNDLERANNSGFLDNITYIQEKRNYSDKFEELKNAARRKYKAAKVEKENPSTEIPVGKNMEPAGRNIGEMYYRGGSD